MILISVAWAIGSGLVLMTEKPKECPHKEDGICVLHTLDCVDPLCKPVERYYIPKLLSKAILSWIYIIYRTVDDIKKQRNDKA